MYLSLYIQKVLYFFIFTFYFGMGFNSNHYNKIIDQTKNKEQNPKRTHDGVVTFNG